MTVKLSPFLHPGACTQNGSLAVLHLRRDHMLPTVLSSTGSEGSEYGVGAVANTRFGSYPHSTLLGQAWGTQVLASPVDTGSRGRGKKNKKRNLDESRDGEKHDASGPNKRTRIEGEAADVPLKNEAGDDQETNGVQPQVYRQPRGGAAAPTGFCHVLPPTPESWTLSLPHRTQVVYTPDYSYILQKIRARPGSVLIEAGAGSGSFTHAAARAVFNGYGERDLESSVPSTRRKQGKVYSFEYHGPRAEQLRVEIAEHGLSPIVHVTHRDVYGDGFLLDPESVDVPPASPNATTIFLDLPAPWQALPHLTRSSPSPLDPTKTVHICIFLPCIEQVQRAVATLRTHGWLEISMQELAQRRIEVRREQVGLDLQGLRNVNATPATVEEAIERLVQVERSGRRYQNMMVEKAKKAREKAGGGEEAAESSEIRREDVAASARKKSERLFGNADDAAVRKLFNKGRLVHRTEPEIRTHTSYLIFAVLPLEWTAEDEARCRKKWPAVKTAMSEKS